MNMENIMLSFIYIIFLKSIMGGGKVKEIYGCVQKEKYILWGEVYKFRILIEGVGKYIMGESDCEIQGWGQNISLMQY